MNRGVLDLILVRNSLLCFHKALMIAIVMKNGWSYATEIILSMDTKCNHIVGICGIFHSSCWQLPCWCDTGCAWSCWSILHFNISIDSRVSTNGAMAFAWRHCGHLGISIMHSWLVFDASASFDYNSMWRHLRSDSGLNYQPKVAYLSNSRSRFSRLGWSGDWAAIAALCGRSRLSSVSNGLGRFLQ